MTLAVILAAAGASTRMGGGQPKPLLPLAGRRVLEWSLLRFAADPQVSQILVMAPRELLTEYQALCAPFPQAQVYPGGETRGATVALALPYLLPQVERVAIHDGARPLLSSRDWQALCQAAQELPAVIAAGPMVDTVKLLAEDGSGRIQQGLPRPRLAAAQTPQIFSRALFTQLCQVDAAATDEAELAEALGQPVTAIMTQDANFKLTYPEDIARAEAVLANRLAIGGQQATEKQKEPSRSPLPQAAPEATAAIELTAKAAPGGLLRIGTGWDRHRLAPGRRLILGGVEIPAPYGCLGHSDGDPLLHALIDALFGAAALGDIGAHFSDTDPAYAGADSLLLLERCRAELNAAGWQPVNLDATVLLQRPHLQAYLPAMRQRIAVALHLSEQAISIKAKTGEGIGPVGEGLVAEAQAIALIESRRPGQNRA